MRAVQPPRAVAVPAENAIPSLMRALVALVAILALLLVASPVVLRAQDSTTTHKVLSGETLWSLATRFYGDGHKWHDLARLNGLGDNGEKGLSVGQVIKVPTRKVAATVGKLPPKPAATDSVALKVPAGSTVAEKPALPKPAGSGALSSQTAGKSDAAAKASAKNAPKTAAKSGATQTAKAADTKPTVVAADSTKRAAANNAVNAEDVAPARTHIWSVEIPAQRSARGKDVSTVFQGHTYDRDDASSATPLSVISEAPRVRTGEFEAAPFPLASSRFSGTALVGRRVGAASAGSSRVVERMLLADEVEIQLPAGANAAVGTRYSAVTMGAELSPGVRLAVPTGVLQIVRAEAGKAPVARVVRQSGIISQGENLIPVEGSPAAAGVKATAVGANGGPESRVLWVREGELLPSLQSYLVIAAGEKEGIAPGDEFWLVAKQGVGADAREQRIAVVRVVRVTGAGSTAIVIQQDLPTIAAGVAARRVAKAN